MPDYKAPLRDMRFVLDDVLEMASHYQCLPGAEEATPDTVAAILEEGARFVEQALAPLNRSGDEEGCQWRAGEVTTPKGFKEAYRQFVAAGWPGMTQPPQYGGQGLPHSLGLVFEEMICGANMAWGMYPGLSRGAMDALRQHGSEEQRRIYLSKLIEGRWTGTMCLTEAHCGTDLGLVRTKAEPQADGSYRLSGSKIFISAGEHDLAENIVHLVLARLPDAPAGTRGLSLFIVPKFLPDAEGEAGARNGVSCGSIEHKMGIHGNATCVLNFDHATGFLVGPPNKGLACMFTMMNAARIGVGVQGLGIMEAAYQGALTYARERLQMRAPNGPKYPDKPADPLIVHPDVRRLLLTQKAFAEGGRMLAYFAGQLVDLAERAEAAETRAEAEELLGLLTPIVKGFLTEVGFEAANEGLQVFGGHGYIREWGMEQLVRDSRITRLYEGTTGIQALDLLGRKVLMTQGRPLHRFNARIDRLCQSLEGELLLQEFVRPLARLNREWRELSTRIGMVALQDQAEVGAAAVDYLMYSGYVTLAYLWTRAAAVAHRKLTEEGTTEAAFYRAKLHAARFYFQRLLPRTRALAATMSAGADSLLALPEGHFGLGFEG